MQVQDVLKIAYNRLESMKVLLGLDVVCKNFKNIPKYVHGVIVE